MKDIQNNHALLAIPSATHIHFSHFAITHHQFIRTNICAIELDTVVIQLCRFKLIL
jgi:hypothetical protein